MIEKYTPSNYITELFGPGIEGYRKPDPMPGFAGIVARAIADGCQVTVDFEEGYEEEVNSQNCRMAAHEVDMALFAFRKGGKVIGRLATAANNGGPDDWLCDYHLTLLDYVKGG